jgi:hypothetical protein
MNRQERDPIEERLERIYRERLRFTETFSDQEIYCLCMRPQNRAVLAKLAATYKSAILKFDFRTGWDETVHKLGRKKIFEGAAQVGKSLVNVDVAVDVDTQEMFANALTRNVVELVMDRTIKDYHPRFREALWRNMAMNDCKLRVLRVLDCYCSNDTLVLPMLRYAPNNWTLRELYLKEVYWTPEFDDAISEYLKATNNLRKLRFEHPSFPSAHRFVFSSALFLAALGLNQSLEEISFFPEWAYTGSESLKQAEFIIMMKCQRRQLGSRLLGTVTAETFLAALQEVDRNCLFEFLRHNEFNLQATLQRHARHGDEHEQEDTATVAIDKQKTNW